MSLLKIKFLFAKHHIKDKYYKEDPELIVFSFYSKTCVKWPLKNRQNKDLNENDSLKVQVLQNAPWSLICILLTCIKL